MEFFQKKNKICCKIIREIGLQTYKHQSWKKDSICIINQDKFQTFLSTRMFIISFKISNLYLSHTAKARTTEFTWTEDSFQKFQNTTFFKISKIPFMG